MNMENIREPGRAFNRALVSLESGISDVLDEALSQPLLAGGEMELDSDPVELDLAVFMTVDIPAETTAAQPEVMERITAHTRQRLAAFTNFDESRSAAQTNLDQIGEALAGMFAAHHLSREFLNDCYADIHRANEMEVQNAILSSENRRQAKLLDKLDKQRLRYESLVEMQKRRERKLTQEISALRDDMNATKLEGVEARNILAGAESQLGELHGALAAKTGLAERLLRENETLRERTINFSLDLDKALKKQAEIRRAHDELQVVHASGSARQAEMSATLAVAEKEVAAVQKLHDGLAGRLAETEDQLRALELEMNEREKRHDAENRALKSENQALAARLQAAAAEHLDAVSEVAALQTRLSSSDAGKHVAEKKYAALRVKAEKDGKQAGTAKPESTESPLVEMHKQEAAALRAQVAQLTEKLNGLMPRGKPHKAAKQRTQAKPKFPEAFGRKPLRLRPEMAKAVHAGM